METWTNYSPDMWSTCIKANKVPKSSLICPVQNGCACDQPTKEAQLCWRLGSSHHQLWGIPVRKLHLEQGWDTPAKGAEEPFQTLFLRQTLALTMLLYFVYRLVSALRYNQRQQLLALHFFLFFPAKGQFFPQKKLNICTASKGEGPSSWPSTLRRYQRAISQSSLHS